MKPEEFPEKYRLKLQEWARLDGEARYLEKLEKIVLAELVNRSNQSSIAKAEHWARAHQDYKGHCVQMVEKRTEANVLRAEVDGMEKWHETWRTIAATKRAEMKL